MIAGLVLLSVPIVIFAHANFLISTFLFFGVPSAYLIWRKPDNFRKATVAGIIIGLIFGFSFDFVAEFNHAWGWAVNFALPGTIFGVVSLDVLVWFFFWVFLIVAYYEYFIENDRSTRISKNAKWAVGAGVFMIIYVIVARKFFPALLAIKYAYAELGIIVFILCALMLYRNHNIIPKVIRLLPFFIFMYLTYEITALYMNLWTFPGAYVGLVTINTIVFPLEELLVWIISSSAIVAVYYEFFIDDYK